MVIAFPRCQREPANAGDARQRLAAETHRGNGRQILRPLDFARGMAFQRKQRVIAAHARAVIGHAHQASPARPNFDRDFLRPGIEGVFDQFLDHARRPLHHFAGGDLVGDLLGKQLDAVHLPDVEASKS